MPGDAAESHLIELVTTDDKDERMPKDKPPLSADDMKTLREWIDAGLPWEAGFTFAATRLRAAAAAAAAGAAAGRRRPDEPGRSDSRRVSCSSTKSRGRRRSTTRRFCGACISTSSACCRRPMQLHAFLADNDPAKREQVIDELLADNQAYAEHWLSFWNDLLRNDYQGTGYIDGGRKQISAWLYRALLENKPFDEFVRELIAPSPESEGFIRGIKWRGNVNASQKQEVAVRPERVAGVSGHEHEVRFVPRQLHRSLEAGGDVRPGGDLRRRAAGDVSLRQADRQDGRGGLAVSRTGADRSEAAEGRSGCKQLAD